MELAAFNARKQPTTIIPVVAVPERHTLTIHRGSFQAFVRLSDREQRPVEEVMSEWLSDCAALIRSQEQDDFGGYGLAAASTSAMREAAATSEAREDREWRQRAEMLEAGYIHPALVEINLSLEGE